MATKSRLSWRRCSSSWAAPDEATPKPKALTAECDGFNLHAATHFEAADREAIERFCRYAGRGPLALARLWNFIPLRDSLAENGNVVYRLKTPRPDGTTHVIFTPLSFLTRRGAIPDWKDHRTCGWTPCCSLPVRHMQPEQHAIRIEPRRAKLTEAGGAAGQLAGAHGQLPHEGQTGRVLI